MRVASPIIDYPEYFTRAAGGGEKSPGLGITEVKTVPYVPPSHPFVERLIGGSGGSLLEKFEREQGFPKFKNMMLLAESDEWRRGSMACRK